MKIVNGWGLAVAAGACALILLLPKRVPAQPSLLVTYGSQGLQRLSYKGTALEDLVSFPSDAFHIWHIKLTDLAGNIVSSGQYGWGENNNGRTWDPASHTWTYPFVWGSIQVQYIQTGDTLDLVVTETNAATSGVILDGAVIYPLVLHFPQLPDGFVDHSYPQLAYNTIGPSTTLASFGTGEVAGVVPNASRPLYSGFLPADSGNAYIALISGTSPDGLATFQPHNDRAVAPGQTDTFTVSLRFAPSGTPLTSLAADAYQSWAATYPAQLKWADRRVIGTVYLASSPQGNVNQPAGYANNPRRYFNDSNPSDFDLRTANGLAAFQTRILAQAQSNVTNLRMLNAQGVITWDIEGEQYPQDTSYVCSPNQIAVAAPEMESIVTDSSSPYAGMKLDDAYFKTMRDAGFRVGVCIRPQHFTLNSDGTAGQKYLDDSAVEAEMLGKMQYAHDRWGATLFYIDSTVESNGAVLNAGLFQQAALALPDSLLIPEESTPRHYAYTAPFQTFLFHRDLGTDATVYNYYPKAFSANLINDVDPTLLAQYRPQLTQSVRNGDILMAHADYWQANNSTIVQIYADAGVALPPATPPGPAPVPAPTPIPAPTPTPSPAPAPAPATSNNVVITSPATGALLTGSVSVEAAISVPLDAAGSFLMVDGQEIGTKRFTSGPYSFGLDTTTLASGSHTLQIWAHDIGNNTDLSAPVAITVSNTTAVPGPTPIPAPSPSPAPAPPSGYPIALMYPISGQAISNTIQVAAIIGRTLDAAGSFLMVDGVEWGTSRIGSAPFLYSLDATALTAGAHALQIWAHDINNETLLSNIANIFVTR